MPENVYHEALRLRELGMAIVPIPHGCRRPRFDWRIYQEKGPALFQLETWFEARVGLGAICGKASRNLVALEFSEPGAYLHWRSQNPKLAAKIPTIAAPGHEIVLYKTPQPMPTGNLWVPGYPRRAGRVLGEGSLVVLPPTLAESGIPIAWSVPIHEKNYPTFIGFEEGGVQFRAVPPAPPKGSPTAENRKPNASPPADLADLYGHIFTTADSYRETAAYVDRRWVVEGLIPETYLVILAGDSKSGKSCLLTALGMAVAGGDPFLGMRTTRGAVLWVAYEESPQERREALEAHPAPYGPFYVTHEKLLIDTDEGLEALAWWVRRTEAKLIVIDPLYAATAAESLSDGRSARRALAGLKDLCRRERCAAVVLHHFNKDSSSGLSRDRFADSHQIVAAASMDILMDSRPTPQGREIVLRSRGRGEFANRCLVLASSGVGDYRLIGSDAEASAEAVRRDGLIVKAVSEATKPVTAAEIAEATSLSLKTVQNTAAQLAREGLLLCQGKRGNWRLYSGVPTS